ncbi:DUF1641 domain-containing protein [Desulforhopalus singaporensis]|uniref:DUF1641 domain-containing protein n=1 Tax=Desulforhopalus singaporensis TaxID=91360 RepID=A0A1H0JUL7_9BACT|nr:DUF1641 domain-containing protein [Desulforhopalus singaporensis]SDO47505.1 Protein of unknown function [Desulforhopalus singaporensis]
MNEALILEKLDKLSDEVRSMKADILQEVRQELRLTPGTAVQADVAELLGGVDEEYSRENLMTLSTTLLGSLEELNEVVRAVKSGIEFKDDMGPVVKQVYPKSIEFFSELEGEFHIDEVIILLRKTLTNLDTMGEGLDMLRAGVELRDELVPILQLMYPRILRFLNALHEGEFQAEKLGDLLHIILLNIHTLSDLLNMLQPMTELVKEVGVLMKETDVLNGVNVWLDGLQQGSGAVRLAGTLITFMRRVDFSEKQIEDVCRVIDGLDFSYVKPVGPLGLVKKLNDPQVQEAFGFMFMMLQAVGGCLQAYRSGAGSQEVAK